MKLSMSAALLLLQVMLAAFALVTEAAVRGQQPPQPLRKLTTRTPLMGYGGTPDSSRFPLGLCEGDCDRNSDCEGTLVCHQRTNNGDGPSECSGWQSFDAKTDFCVYGGYGNGDGDDDDWAYGDDWAMNGNGDGNGDTDTDTESTGGDILNAELANGDTDSFEFELLPLTFVQEEGSSSNTGMPLGLCHGDCDTDSDCLDDLVCFQRDMLEPVRGCSGEGSASVDYCTRPTGAQATVVQTYNVGVVNSGLQLETITTSVIVQSSSASGNTNVILQNANSLPLGQCQGDCDRDSDCIDPNMICFQRDGLEPVPGCSGLGMASYDYCIIDPNYSGLRPLTTVDVTSSSAVVINSGLDLQVVSVNSVSPFRRLGLCQGDCDSDSDCIDDLICFQREASEAVPGCNGSGRRSYDYCIINPILGGQRPLTTTTTVVTTGTSGSAMNTAYYLMIITFDTNAGTQGGGDLGQPLGACQGDCNTDADCLDDLVCFQRDGDEDVPGCAGTPERSADYCVFPANFVRPPSTVAVGTTLPPGSAPTTVQLEFVSDGGSQPLGLCQGDCDSDDDCMDNLVCFQRDALENVPGCLGSGDMSFDYCIYNPSDITSESTTIIIGGSSTIDVNSGTMLEVIMNDRDVPLGHCQGDCDSDEDCLDNLRCFQRLDYEPVPTCIGLGSRSYDYCVYGNVGGSTGVEISGGGSFQQGCNEDSLMCPDGTVVGRNPSDNCEFFACPGIDLSLCSAGCRSYEQCRDQALALGLELGSNEYDFAAVYSVKGCHFYTEGPYANQAFFGFGATTCDDIIRNPTDGADRLLCNGQTIVIVEAATRPPDPPTNRPTPFPTPNPTPFPTPFPTPNPTPLPTNQPTPQPTNRPTDSPVTVCSGDTFLCADGTSVGRNPANGCAFFGCPAIDVSFCETGALCGTFAGCRDQAQALGLQLGSNEFPFAGDYPIKGCHYYPPNSGDFSRQAYWGTGATSCDDIVVEPTDGAQRLPCPDQVVVIVAGGVSLPTNPPTPNPTPNPTPVPTPFPTPFPTPNPTPNPTNPPVPSPTQRPTANPTRRPTVAPVNVCANELQQCNDGTFVERNPANNCAFYPCSSGVSACLTGSLQCADGSIVSRVPPSCEFEACPAIVIEAAIVRTQPPSQRPTAPPTNPPVDPSPVAPVTVCSNELRQCADGSFVSRNPRVNCLFYPCPDNAVACENDAFQCADGTLVTRELPYCFFADCPPIDTVILEAAQNPVAAPVAPPVAPPVVVLEASNESSKKSDKECFDEVQISNAMEAGVAGKGKGKAGKAGRRRANERKSRGRRTRGERKLQGKGKGNTAVLAAESSGGRQGCIDATSTVRIRASSHLDASSETLEVQVESSAFGMKWSGFFLALAGGLLAMWLTL